MYPTTLVPLASLLYTSFFALANVAPFVMTTYLVPLPTLFSKTMQALRDGLVQVAKEQANHDNEELSGLLNTMCPPLRTTPDIAQKVSLDSRSTKIHISAKKWSQLGMTIGILAFFFSYDISFSLRL